MKKVFKFFNGVKKEVSRVRWPNKRELFKYSVSTIAFMLFLAGFFYLFDTIIALITTLVG